VLEERELDVEIELDGEGDLRVRLLPHEMGSGSGPCGSLVFPHEKRLQGVGAKFGSGSRGSSVWPHSGAIAGERLGGGLSSSFIRSYVNHICIRAFTFLFMSCEFAIAMTSGS
jgi:hypothetical protein